MTEKNNITDYRSFDDIAIDHLYHDGVNHTEMYIQLLYDRLHIDYNENGTGIIFEKTPDTMTYPHIAYYIA